MKIFLDTASLSEIEWAVGTGLIDGVTTNPSLMARDMGNLDPKDVIKKICGMVDGSVSAEVISLNAEDMYTEGKALAAIADNVTVKIPMLEEGLVATRRLAAEGIDVNVTLCFSSMQCLLAAKAGAAYVSPFIGRVDDIGQVGMEIISESRQIFDNYGIKTEILAASIRHTRHVADAALIGADVATIPTKILKQMMLHPLTDRGLDQFLNDWSKVASKEK
jgi:transaldolase